VPSLTLLGQSLLSGLFLGGLYGLLGLGLSLTWGMLRLINLTYFALAFLGAYLTYQLATVFRVDPLLTLLLIIPGFFLLGVLLQEAFVRTGVNEFISLIVTFGLTLIIEAVIQWIWTADFRRLESGYGAISFTIGKLFVPLPELLAFLIAAAVSFLTWAWLKWTYVGKAMRATAEDPQIAAAFGVNHRRLALLISGLGAAYAGIAGAFIALIYTLAPSQVYAWIGVVFAAVIIGGLGNPLGLLAAGILIGVSEAVTMAVTAPGWAPLVSFTLLILVLLLRPERI
jgi:branched-chain amino acid transport system permease protein